ncbi:MAG: acyltransferase [Chthoniobacter sp.]|uniref:acyltransferase family protein n=1 Tax=Chthoniobacter sp. TaxID=2510640 RepID=UPI0032A2595A
MKPAPARAGHILYLDGWRGLAVLAVLVGHYIGTKGVYAGRFGVELFFVLSGRLMAEILFVRQTPLPSFFRRRISRVYPALFVFVTVLMIYLSIRDHAPLMAHYFSALTFTLNYSQFWIGRLGELDHIWSLCVEEHMYLLLGVIAFFRRKAEFNIAVLCTVLAVAASLNGMFQTLHGHDYYDVYWRTDVHGASILIGVAVYLFWHEKVPAALSSPWAPVFFGIGGLLLNANPLPDYLKYSVGTAFLATSLVLMHRAPRRLLSILEHPFLLRFGIWSYSIYLYQQPFYKAAHDSPHRLLLLPLAIGLAWLSYRFIEQPARNYLNRVWHTGKSKVIE